MIDITKKYKTRDGRDVRIYATVADTGRLTHGAIDLSADGVSFTICSWTADGRYCAPLEHVLDLIPVPVLRPWTAENAPKIVMLRPDGGHSEPRPRVWRLRGDGFKCCTPYNELASENMNFTMALNCYVRILEDGSEVPCGVEE